MTDKNIDSLQVYGLCNVFYDSYYIKGLQDYFGISNVEFNTSNFPDFYQHTFAVIVKSKGKTIKIVIDSRDANYIRPDELKWCDVYGKVNYHADAIPEEGHEKVIPIGPNFGIKIWNLPQTIFKGLQNTIRFRKGISRKKELLANYWRQYNRLPLSDYFTKETPRRHYVFFMATIWKKEPQTNLFRSNYIRACKANPEITFEGGFAPRKDGDNPGFDGIITEKRYPFTEYLQKTKQSMMVFNTPAVFSCHGWKLGEFMAMGKAILSTAHHNVLPAPLTDGIHLLYVDGHERADFDEKIAAFLASDADRKMMETNVKAYFDRHLSPEKVIEILYTAAQK